MTSALSAGLTIFSTLSDLRQCSDDVIRRDINNVSRDVVLQYVLELRAQGPPLTTPPFLNADDKKGEEKAARAKSSRAQIQFTTRFTNECTKCIDLIWKNYEGEEVVVRQNIDSGVTHAEHTYLTHPFIARESDSGNLKTFKFNHHASKVFEGLNFEVHSGEVSIRIVD